MPLVQIRDHTFMRQLLSSDSIILDLGANRGDFSYAMIEKYGCRSIAVEANPAMSALIPSNPKLTVVNAAAGGADGTLPFYINPHDEKSSLLRPGDGEKMDEVQVPCYSLPTLMSRYEIPKIDLLKVDIEGAEIGLLESAPADVLKRIPQITVEFHDFNGTISKDDAERVVERLRSLNFDVYQMWMRSYGDTLFVNRELARIGAVDRCWSHSVTRNWWWLKRFVKRKMGLSQ